MEPRQRMSSNIILMAGDSWPAGVYEKENTGGPAGPGIAENLQKLGYQVRNLAKPGGSNLESVDRLKDYLACNTQEINNIKFVLFWQTEFFREIWYYRKSNIYSSVEKELEPGYTKLRDAWVYRPYYRLSEIGQKWNIPIYVIGGASDTVWYDDFLKDFPGVRIACQSVTNMLVNNDHRIDQPVFCEYMTGWIDEGDFLTTIKENISNRDLQHLLTDIELGESRVQTFKDHPELFYPDGMHPNKVAHNLIFEFLKKNIPELTNEVA
jgi:lysophospholipase L1-like esterase